MTEDAPDTPDDARSARAGRAIRSHGVALPVALTLAIQAVVSMSVVALPVLMPVAAVELDVPASHVGILMSVIYLSATLISPVSGFFIGRFGAIRASQFCLLLCALGLVAVSVPLMPLMAAGALVMGIGYGPVTPASSHLLVRTTPLSMMSVVFSIKQTGVPLGGALAGALVPQLVLLFGWRVSALWVAAAGLMLLLLLFPYRRRFDTEPAVPGRLSWRGAVAPVKMTLRHAGLRQLAIASFFFSTMQLCLVSFLVAYLIGDLGMSLVRAGVLLSAAQASGIVGRVVWGAFADRIVKPRVMLGALGLAMSAGALLASLFSPGWPYGALLAACALFGSVAIGWNGVYLAEVARVAAPGQAATATGGTLFFTFLGILLGLPAFSLVVEKTGSYPIGFAAVAAATAICGAVLLVSREARR